MKIVSPKNFMKSRRPDKFSDSIVVKEATLNRTILEYQLDTLTSKKQEYQFEEFSRKLCQFEICPGLRPQTGPTGGGDGKVDSETIPKSKELAYLYCVGSDKTVNEEWAFAFSAKKGWKQKVVDDAKKIVETKRGYKRIFFVTNQYIKPDIRADLEYKLSSDYKIKVTILDKTWILDKVFENNREKLAIEELGLGDGLEQQIDVGPVDFQKAKKIKELSKSIEKDVVYNHISIKTVSNVLDSAILTAELEKPKSEVIGNFDKAIKFAEDYGTSDQLFTAIYQKAWVTYFWLEDFNNFLKLYDEVEDKALRSANIFSVERLNNLWTILYTLSRNTTLVSKETIEEKTRDLQKKLKSFIGGTHISASVQAEALLLLMELMLNFDKEERTTRVFKELFKIIEKANLLIGFPIDSTFDLLNELQNIFNSNEAYEKLQERIVEITTQRYGDIKAAEILYSRGLRYYESELPYEAISYLGKALYKFYKKESKNDLVRTLLLLSMAYEDVGLLWAARGALINAASYATSDFWLYSEISKVQLMCYERLRTIELRLGNIGYALEWHRLNHAMASQLINSEADSNKFLEKNLYYGSIVGLLLIKTPDEDLKSLEYLPDLLFSLDLDLAAFGLIFRLGCHDLLPQEFVKDQTPDDLQNFFNSFLTQPAQEDLPDKPLFWNKTTIQLKSRILGSEFIVEVPNSSPEIELGEYFLAALESFLSTTISYAVARDRQIFISVKKDPSQDKMVSYSLKKDKRLGIDITCKDFNPHKLTLAEQKEISNSFSEVVLYLIGNSIIFRDTKTDLLKLFKDEEVSSRAFSFSSPLVNLGNVLGYSPQRSISQWLPKNYKKYPYVPEKSGQPNQVPNSTTKKSDKADDTFNSMHLKHNEIENISIIHLQLWDQAHWKGVMYFVPPDRPPVLALIFENKDAGEAIFEDWINTFSRVDKEEILRVSMLRGISKKNPSWYRAVIGMNLKNNKSNTGKIITVSKVHTMNAESTQNLDRFSESFNKFGIYLFAPAILNPSTQYPDITVNLGIIKRSFEDRRAWEIGANDLDMGGIVEGDDLIVPEDIKNPPVLELLKWKSRKKNV